MYACMYPGDMLKCIGLICLFFLEYNPSFLPLELLYIYFSPLSFPPLSLPPSLIYFVKNWKNREKWSEYPGWEMLGIAGQHSWGKRQQKQNPPASLTFPFESSVFKPHLAGYPDDSYASWELGGLEWSASLLQFAYHFCFHNLSCLI